MNPESERELAIVILEEKAKIVLGDEYGSLPYEEWVEELKTFVLTQRCPDCGAGYDLDEPEEEIWAWFLEGEGVEMEEVEVVQFLCEASLDVPEPEREVDHPLSWGVLLFRRDATGTFPLDDDVVDDSEN